METVEFKKFSPIFDADVVAVFDVRSSLAQRRATGALSSKNVAAQTKCWLYNVCR